MLGMGWVRRYVGGDARGKGMLRSQGLAGVGGGGPPCNA